MSKQGKAKLRAVAPGEKPQKPVEPPKTIAEAVERDERSLLVALRAKVAAEIDEGVPAAYLAPVMRQLREVDMAIRKLDAREEQEAAKGGHVVDEAFDASAI